ncbi:hypothetical protein AB0D49_23655 [Streptomyces sp. NPDC048290]|uniref:Rv1733c family protein n=1 Tax=Streptomyces sp. NPDC048290 TaxID=3155811 RepID=UPI0034441CFD
MVIRDRRVWLWRWRRNALRRPSDRTDARVLLASWTLAVLAVAVAGPLTARSVESTVARDRMERRPVTASLAAPVPGAPSRAAADLVWAHVTWTAPDGSTRAGQTRVAPGSRAGKEVTVWTDRAGRLVTEPATATEARVHSLLVGGLAGAVAAVLPLIAGSTLRARLERRRLDQWDADWARFDALRRRHLG